MKKKAAKKKVRAKKAKPKTKRKPAKRVVAKKKTTAAKKEKPIGAVTHYYGNIGVAIVKFKKVFKTGGKVRFKGATTDFEQKINSIQYNHKPVAAAKKGQLVGIKTGDKAREGDMIYEAGK